MGALDTTFRDLASTLIGVFSDEYWTLTRNPPAGFDPVSGEELVATATTFQVKLSPPVKFSTREIDGTSVLRGDLQASLAAKDSPIVPDTATDTLSKDGTTYRIISVNPEPSGDEVAMYTLQLRK